MQLNKQTTELTTTHHATGSCLFEDCVVVELKVPISVRSTARSASHPARARGTPKRTKPLSTLRIREFFALMERFDRAPEARALTRSQALPALCGLAEARFGAPLEGCTPTELEALLDEELPAFWCFPLEETTAVVEELRALYRFLGREDGLAHAEACLALLDEDAARKLANRIENTDKWKQREAIAAMARDAGFDLTTSDGFTGFRDHLMETGRGERVVAPRLPAPRRATSADVRGARKARRRAQREARRRSR